tara:strand:- start:106 stop:1005 length:900 start_codon:yes stop_codon:yes gene_type:complete
MQTTKPLVIVLLGPTASGKTDLGIEIAKKLKLDIHNIDSRQIYKGMDIGTAKPTKDQQKIIKHFLIDICEPNQPITFHEFQKIAQSSLQANLKKKAIGLLVGGSGLYLQALTKGLQPPAVGPQKSLRKQLQKIGQYQCHQILQQCDPIAAKKISVSDYVRTIRALEVFYATAIPMSQQKKSQSPPWKILEIGLDPTNLKEKISHRTQQIYNNGLIEETKYLINKFGKDLPLLKTIGYQEALSIITGEINVSEAIEITTKRTNDFAKRQRTWFKKQHTPTWLNDEKPLRESISLIQDVIG